MRDYRIERALVADGEVFNLGDNMILLMNDDSFIKCILQDISWIDEYTASLVTTEGVISMDDVATVIRSTN